MTESHEVSREDLCVLLGSTGAVLPATTKIPDATLKKRVGLALDISQEVAQIFGAKRVDPCSLSLWPKETSMYDASRRGSILESINGASRHPWKGEHAVPDKTFTEMRQTLDCITYGLDHGKNDVLLLGPSKGQAHGAIFIRTLNVYEVNDSTPLLVLAFKELEFTTVDAMALELGLIFMANPGQLTTLSISSLERYAWMVLLNKNKDRLASSIHDQLEEQYGAKLRIYPSFMLPLSPLGMESIGRLTKDSRCDVCQKKDSRVCEGCRSAQYCGKECQKTDWPKHKAACRALRGTITWRRFTTTDMPFGKDLPFRSLINARDPLHKSHSQPLEKWGCESVEYGKLFLVKFQLALGAPQSSHMLLYDRTRSFITHWWRASDPALFDEAARIIGPRGKFYRWIRRVSDTELEICLEKGPQEIPLW